jgi:hypothetical protein
MMLVLGNIACSVAVRFPLGTKQVVLCETRYRLPYRDTIRIYG